MVRLERWFGNGGIYCRCFSKSTAEAVRNCAIKGQPRIVKDLNGICPREGKNKKNNMAEKKKSCDYSSDSPPIFMVQ